MDSVAEAGLQQEVNVTLRWKASPDHDKVVLAGLAAIRGGTTRGGRPVLLGKARPGALGETMVVVRIQSVLLSGSLIELARAEVLECAEALVP